MVTDGRDALISYAIASVLELVQMIHMVRPSRLSQLLQSDEDMFEGIGKLKGQQIKLHIDDKGCPVVLPHKHIPFHVRKLVAEELARLEEPDIIKQVESLIPWISPLVVAQKTKKPGKIQICVAICFSNQAVKHERYHPPPYKRLLQI